MKTYVITAPGYHSYEIVTATTDEQLANAIAEKFDGRVEAFENADAFLKNCWFVRFRKDGSIVYCLDKSKDPYHIKYAEKAGFRKSGIFTISVFADSAEEAVRIATEKRTQFLSELSKNA